MQDYNTRPSSLAEHRIQILANGYRKTVTADKDDIRFVLARLGDVSVHYAQREEAAGTLRLAIFIKAAKMTGLGPAALIRALSEMEGGDEALIHEAEQLALRRKLERKAAAFNARRAAEVQ